MTSPSEGELDLIPGAIEGTVRGEAGDPTTSVLIIAYNRTSYLREAVDSVLSQKIQALPEIIVVTNLPVEAAPLLPAGHDINLVTSFEENYGAALLSGAKSARGEIICILDDDDLFLPEKIAYTTKVFAEHPQAVYYHNSFVPVAANARGRSPLPHSNPNARIIVKGRLEAESRFRTIERVSGGFNHSCISVRRELITDNGGLLSQIAALGDVVLLELAMLSNRELVIDDEVLTAYRVHLSSSRSPLAHMDGQLARMSVRLKRIIGDWDLICRESEGSAFLRYYASQRALGKLSLGLVTGDVSPYSFLANLRYALKEMFLVNARSNVLLVIAATVGAIVPRGARLEWAAMALRFAGRRSLGLTGPVPHPETNVASAGKT
jgi:glycosyltransferase involved in cell wall biosynthesis